MHGVTMKNTVLFDGSQTSPSRPYDKNSIKNKKIMEDYPNDTNKCQERQCIYKRDSDVRSYNHFGCRKHSQYYIL